MTEPKPPLGSYQECARALTLHGFRRTDYGLIAVFTYDTGGLFLLRVTLSASSDSTSRLELGARGPDGSRRWRPWRVKTVVGRASCTREALDFLAAIT